MTWKSKDPASLFKPAKSSADLIKAFRKNFEISQEEMAKACEITQSYLSAIENGRKEVGPKIAVKISAFLGIPLDQVMFPAGYENERAFVRIRKKMTKVRKKAS
jgi:transcriptional regulator with XRE-family HTH domain